MIKKIILIIALLSLFLAGCQQSIENPNQRTTSFPFKEMQANGQNSVLKVTSIVNTGEWIPSGCTAISPKPTPGPTEQSLFPAVTDNDWIFGSDNAYITIIEYSDFQCPYCAKLAPILNQIKNIFPNDVRIVYRHYPLLSIHDKAALATQAAEAAGRQGKFWEMHDLLFEKQAEWNGMTLNAFKDWLINLTDVLGIDKVAFTNDLSSEEISSIPNKNWQLNQAAGIPFTPFVLINQQIWPESLPLNLENLESIIKLNLLERKQFTSCPPSVINLNKNYTAIIDTNKGKISIHLFVDITPIAVNNFIFLAREGWYDGVVFHRVIPGYIAQAGDPSGTGYGTPGYAFVNEISPDLKFDQPGLLAMANAGPNTNGCQFFITLAPAPNLDGKYTIFGKVIDGIDVVTNLSARDPSAKGPLASGDVILTIEIIEK